MATRNLLDGHDDDGADEADNDENDVDCDGDGGRMTIAMLTTNPPLSPSSPCC